MNFASQLPYASAICAVALAAGVLVRSRRTVSDWAFAAGMLVLAAEGFFSRRSIWADNSQDAIFWQQWQMVVASFIPGTWLLFSLSYARGNSAEFRAHWRKVLWGSFLVPPAIAILFRSELLVAFYLPIIGVPDLLKLTWPGYLLQLLALASSVAVLMNLERTFRASTGTMRWRIKFVLLGVGVLFIVRLYTSSEALLFGGIDRSLQSLNTVAVPVAALLILRGILRAGLFDTDVYPSQSVLQGSVVVALAGIYLLIVGLLAKVANYLGGDSKFAPKALVALVSLVALAVLLQSDRVRLHLRRFVSRNFQRPLYDYRSVWRKFTEGTASRMEQTDLCRSLVRLVADMFQALSVAIWLMDDTRETFNLAASTSLPEAKGRELEPTKAEALEISGFFGANPEPVDIESSDENWALLLKRMHPSEFPNGGHRVCIPLVSQGKVMGLIAVGDRVSGVAFSLQDFDVLRCASEHATAGILNVQLSQKLLQSKEMEAFQTMAAFFVHDLKNAASTLNLMLRNLPVHFDDPAFREDTLRGISKTVAHINGLIGRLSMIRQELKIQTVESDLNEVIDKALVGLETAPGFSVVKTLPHLPRIRIDREQVAKVVTNLVLNGMEAMSGKGEIQLSTGLIGNWVVLTVTDQGSGMSAGFLNNSLFRPFQTTKKSGLGIGMFQSKMIVEAHGGRIAVTSEQGRGTTFQVFLPMRTQEP